MKKDLKVSSVPRSAQVVNLADRRKPSETADYLRALAREAEEGKIIGVIAAAHYDSGEFRYVGSGSLCASPPTGVYAVQQLMNKLLQG